MRLELLPTYIGAAILFLLSLYCWYAIWRLRKDIKRDLGITGGWEEPKIKKKIAVPGKGFFSVPQEKKKPVYNSEAEQWRREKDREF